MLVYNDPTESQTIAVFFLRKTSLCYVFIMFRFSEKAMQTFVAIFLLRFPLLNFLCLLLRFSESNWYIHIYVLHFFSLFQSENSAWHHGSRKAFLSLDGARFYGLKCRASLINFVVTAILNK